MSASTNRIAKGYILSSTFISLALGVLILGTLLISSWPALTEIGWDLFSYKWNPPSNQFGILSMLFGTLSVTLIAMLIATPLGILTAIYISEILPSKYRLLVKSLLELLAGIPSIIYGLIAIAFFSTWIQNLFGLQSGRTIFTAGIILAIMILPTIISLIDDAFQNIPISYRESAKGLGLYPYEVTLKVLFPIAFSDIIGALLLAIGRALGETLAVMLVIGSIDKIPSPAYNLLSPGQTITSKLGREIAESSFGSIHFSVLILMGVILILIVLFLTFIAQLLFHKNERLYE